MKLADRHCIRNAQALNPRVVDAMLNDVPGWQAANGVLRRDFRFADYRATIAFVNAVADMAEAEDHHPDLTVGYGKVGVSWSTHSAGGALTENDFICAARTDALFAQQAAA